jgi:hypothetical protein
MAAAMLSFAPAARAVTLTSCAAGCTSDSTGAFLFGVDYTVPADGRRYQWDLWADASHPTAIITLAAPNEVFEVYGISNGDGTASSETFFSTSNFIWNEVKMPGHTEIQVWASVNFDFCPNTRAGSVCSRSNNVWGNAAGLTTGVSNAITITFAQTPVPEPATWSLLIGGFGALGWALRRRRAAAALAA